jgi:competence protein ComEC
LDKFPLIKFVIVFICGIILKSIFLFEKALLLYLFALFLITAVLIIKYSSSENLKNIFIISAITLFGSVYYAYNSPVPVKYPFNEPKIKNAVIQGRITSIELDKKDKCVFNIETDSIKLLAKAVHLKINLLVKVSDTAKNISGFYDKLEIGNVLKIKGTIARPRNRRNPGEFDYEEYLSKIGTSGLFYAYKTSDANYINKEEDFISNKIFQFRKLIDKEILQLHNLSTAALLRGLILADKSLIEKQLKNDYVNAGVVHVLAVSGQNVAFVIIIFVVLFRRFNIYVRFVLTVIGVFTFLIMTNAPASVTRATIMAVALILSPITGRSYNNINALALAAFIILLFDPSQIFDPGFLLSFSAVLSIVIIYPIIKKSIDELELKSTVIKYLLLFLAVSFAAQIGTLPFTLVYFHRISVVTFAANFFVIPIVGLLSGLGLLVIIIAPLSNYLGSIFASSSELLNYVLSHIVKFMGNPNYSYLTINNFSLIDSLIFYLCLGLAFTKIKLFATTLHKSVYIVLLIITAITWMKIDDTELLEDKNLSVMAIDIGQGDSFLLKLPDGKNVLIDAGDATKYFDNGEGVIMPLLERLGVDKIDYGFVSHIDGDHYRGFIYLIKRGIVKQIIKPAIDTALVKDIEFEKIIKEYNVPFRYYSKEILKIDDVRIYLLNDTTKNNYKSMSTNDRSGMIKLVYGNTSFLFTGDAGIKSEKYYIKTFGRFLRANVLKAGHHGSKTSSSQQFVDIVNPKMVVISAGVANKFKHPNNETIAKFEKLGSRIFQTNIDGAILLQSDGKTIKNINWKNQ